MTIGVVDSTLIIHVFRKNSAARDWMNAQSIRLSVTAITWLEVMYGAPSKAGQAACKAILSQFDMEYPPRTTWIGRCSSWSVIDSVMVWGFTTA